MMYRKILKQAWAITWNHKFLWFFGLFATFLVQGGEYEILWRGISGGGESNFAFWEKLSRLNLTEYCSNAFSLIKSDPLAVLKIFIIFFILFVLSLFFIWLAVVSQAAIVKATAKISSGQKIGFINEIGEGALNFWPVLGLNIISRLVIGGGFLLLSLLVVFSASAGLTWHAALFFLLLFMFFLPLAIVFSLLIKYSIAFAVIKKEKLTNSLKLGWDLFRKNWLTSLEMAFILFFIYFFSSLLIILLTIALAGPFLFLAFAFYQLSGIFGFWCIVVIGLLAIFAIIIGGGSLLNAFQISSWTTLFIELVAKGGVSKLVRVVNNLIGKK